MVRAPWAFSAAWRAVAPWLHERTRARVRIFGAGDDEAAADTGMRAQLHALVDPAGLPARWGGARADGACLPVGGARGGAAGGATVESNDNAGATASCNRERRGRRDYA